LAINIIRKDWFEYRKTILLLTAAMFVPLLVAQSSANFSKSLIAGLLTGGSCGYAYSCFMVERQRRTLQLLLSLPLRPFDLVLAKYASLYSMCLFTANLPGVFLGDIRVLLLMNTFIVVLSTVSMAATVVSDKPWAPVVPLWITFIVPIPLRRLLQKLYPNGTGAYDFVTSHVMLAASFALLLALLTVVLSALYFERRCTHE
jgi:ABC-type Na+ efflux pump permease subunit